MVKRSELEGPAVALRLFIKNQSRVPHGSQFFSSIREKRMVAILVRQKAAGWGAKIIDQLARDLGAEFPGVEGFSPRNLKYMRAFADAWPDEQFVQQVIAQLPWGHQTLLLDRIKDRTTREWYLNAAVENGWSQNVLIHQISTRLHDRQGKALTNFSRALLPEGSDLA
ncbi:MAG TPA: DUF1016 N-terminal domain-containing protein [Terracidiphilus sp.]|jgi:predicted nuclease of restriction endonuclease-like (RecB) superfamily